MTDHQYRTLGKLIADARQAQPDELKACYERIEELTKTLKHAQEALFWHDGEKFECEKDGRTIGEEIAAVLA